MTNRAEILKQKFQASIALPFEHVLPESVVQQVLQDQGMKYRDTRVHPSYAMSRKTQEADRGHFHYAEGNP